MSDIVVGDLEGVELLTLVQSRLQLTRPYEFRGYFLKHTYPRSESSSG